MNLSLDPQAEELNKVIRQNSPGAYDLLSRRGKLAFISKKGIVAQSAEAKGKAINATIGIALDNNQVPVHLASIANTVKLPPEEVFPYAPSYGLPQLRASWQEQLVKKNPTLQKLLVSQPVVAAGVTHGLSVIGNLFIDPGDTLILPDPFWGNYRLIFETTYQASLETFSLFDQGGLNLKGLEEKILAEGKKKTILLNFPNNPTGYAPRTQEALKVASILKKAAAKGKQILVLVDDAYFGLVYEKDVITESFFSFLSDLDRNVLAVKIDGATKEDYAWGFRVGFITYGIRGMTKDLAAALEDKTAGAIRASISNASRLSQSLLLQAYSSPTYQKEKQSHYHLLKKRFEAVKKILAQRNKYQTYFQAYPFNSGYFLSVRLVGLVDAESVRQTLLKEYDTGVIAFGQNLRITFASVAEDKLAVLFEGLYRACRKVKKGGYV